MAVALFALVPKLNLGTHLLWQFHCRSRSRVREDVATPHGGGYKSATVIDGCHPAVSFPKFL